MAADPSIHPSADILRAFALGNMEYAAAEVVIAHLDSCADCRRQAAAASGDDFLERMRQAHGRTSTALPSPPLPEAGAGRTTRGAAPGTQTPAPGSPLPLPAASLPPALASNSQYEILRELGRGGMGVVYLARNIKMDRVEVLKVVNQALLDRPESVERFLREIRSAARLRHHNVVTAYSVPELGDVMAFAMEYVEGEDLARLVKARGPLPLAHACYYAQQVALGLQHAFEKGMVHRDIKPQNLILTREGKKHIVKILDFGLAKATREKGAQMDLTGSGVMMGTPDYMAPEQARDAASADIRADVYSLGCTLYYLLTGKPPFKGRSFFEVLQAHQVEEATPVEQVRPEVAAELAAVVKKMMARDPAQRYQAPAEVAQALAALLKQGVAGPAPTTARAAPAAVRSAVAEETNVPPARVETHPASHGTLAEGRGTAGGSGRRPAGKAAAGSRWRAGAVVAGCVLLLVLAGLWAAGVFKVKTRDGTIVLENLPPGADVLEPAPAAPARNPLDQWFAVGTRWEGKTTFGPQNTLERSVWFTIRSREGNRFTGRYVDETRLDMIIEGVLGDDGMSFRYTSARGRPTLWRLPAAVSTSFTGEGKCTAERSGVDWKATQADGKVGEGHSEYTVRRAGPQKDDEDAWPAPLHPRRAAHGPPGAWRVEAGELVQEPFDPKGKVAPWINFGDLGWRDYDWHLKAMRTAGPDGFRISFDGNRRWTHWYIGGRDGVTVVEFFEFLPGPAKPIAVSPYKKTPIVNHRWYDILIRARGPSLECIRDGVVIFQIPRPDPVGGRVGITCMGMSGRFKDIQVTAPDGKALWTGAPELP
jgi:hypothetical protein